MAEKLAPLPHLKGQGLSAGRKRSEHSGDMMDRGHDGNWRCLGASALCVLRHFPLATRSDAGHLHQPALQMGSLRLREVTVTDTWN